ncbi:hypothetical protein D6B99_11340 [Arachidicoccus soli]|uniref:Uncharacterized protein n=2 Tax=Arachidicoccus soli TaxID=2341117 RepID=A0A386HRE7_9BACT|nr:hypothetical protein D6B99_11340 [Arachidicoccus soli]
MVDILIEEWLALRGNAKKYKYVSRSAQDARPITNNVKALIEIVKYGSKIFTRSDVNKRAEKNNSNVYAAALNNIFNAMKGLRIFDRFGFDLQKENNIEKTSRSVIKDFDEWNFEINKFDWINNESDERLSKYIPLGQLLDLLNNRVDTNIE